MLPWGAMDFQQVPLCVTDGSTHFFWRLGAVRFSTKLSFSSGYRSVIVGDRSLQHSAFAAV